MKITTEQVAKAALFRRMTLDEVKFLLSRTNMLTKHFQKKDYIYLAGDVIDNLCVVVSGTVQMVREDVDGDKSIVGTLFAGETFAENNFGSEGRRSAVSYLAIEECDILLLPFNRLTLGIIGNTEVYSKFFTNMVGIIATHNTKLIEKIEILGKKTLRSKIMAFLEHQAWICKSRKFVIPYNRTDLANFLDADRSAMTRELSKMKRDGLLTFERNVFTLPEKAD